MAVALQNVTKAFAGKPVLQNFSLTLPDKGTVALLGPSGCGKTTLLRLLAGLETPDSGNVYVPPGTRISVVFQEDRLLETLTVLDNVRIVQSGQKAAQRRLAEECLRHCGLLDCAHQYPPQLSGGMRRRVAVARAMAYGGQLLLLDEPFKGLDLQTRQRVAEFVFAPVHTENRLTVLVTHDQTEAALFADTVLHLHGPPLTVCGSGV